MMSKIKFEYLDIPIIRSCNLACAGCLTFSDSQKIKGLVRLENSLEWLNFWANKLDPENIHVFGGEPLLHPQFIDWCITIKKLWPNTNLKVYTNGYYLHQYIDDETLTKLFITNNTMLNIVLTVQNGKEPYYSLVMNNIEKFKTSMIMLANKHSLRKRFNAQWNKSIDRDNTSSISINGNDVSIDIYHQFKMHWQSHYSGFEETLKPNYNYNDTLYVGNHSSCRAKDYINLYKGRLYKCPVFAVVEHTLDTFGLKTDSDWEPYLENYKFIDTNSNDVEILEWFDMQKAPEKICNMCAFSGPKNPYALGSTTGHLNDHLPKKNWIIPIS